MIPWAGVRGIPVGALAPVAVDAPMKRRAQIASALDLAGNLARTAPVPNIAGRIGRRLQPRSLRRASTGRNRSACCASWPEGAFDFPIAVTLFVAQQAVAGGDKVNQSVDVIQNNGLLQAQPPGACNIGCNGSMLTESVERALWK